MRGHVAKKGDNYYIVVDLGRDHKNKRRQKWFSGYTKKRDAEKDLPRVLNELNKGYREPEDITLGEYFKQWLSRKKRSVQSGTYEHYDSYMRKHIIPGLGNLKIGKLEPLHIESFMDEVEEKELSQRSKKHIFRILSSALKNGKRFGVKDGIMEDIEAPRVERQGIEYWTQDEVMRFMASLESRNHATPIILALATGMRRGEVLGLQWSQVDLENKQISVFKQLKKGADGKWFISPQLKTATSYRTIDIDDDTVELLKAQQLQQAKDRMKCGSDYIETGLVCTTSIGDSIKPTYLRTVFNRTVEKSGVNKISFHGLRHTHATLLLGDGVHPKVVQERLGHRSIQTTLDTYSHVVPGIQEVAAMSIQKSLYGMKKEEIKNVVPIGRN